MSKIGVKQIELYIPDKFVPIEDIIDQVSEQAIPQDFSTKEEYTKYCQLMLGLHQISIEEVMEIDEMLEESLKKLFDNGTVKPEDIDLLIFAQEPEIKQKENLVHYFQYKFKMNNAAILTIMGHHCANVPVAISIADSMAAKDRSLQNVLILTGTSIKNESMDNRLIGTYGVLGDAAGSLLLNYEGNIHIDAQGIATKGRYYQANSFGQDPLLHFKGFTNSIKKLNQLAKIEDSLIDHILVANASTVLASQVLEFSAISTLKIAKDNFGKYGHLDCVDFMLNMKSVLDSEAYTNVSILTMDIGLAGSYVTSLFHKS